MGSARQLKHPIGALKVSVNKESAAAAAVGDSKPKYDAAKAAQQSALDGVSSAKGLATKADSKLKIVTKASAHASSVQKRTEKQSAVAVSREENAQGTAAQEVRAATLAAGNAKNAQKQFEDKKAALLSEK